MTLRKLLAFTLLVAVTQIIGAVSPYDVLATRASRFYAQKEWAQASAVYDLMLEQRPEVISTYGKAITSAAMRADSAAQMNLMQQALDNHIPFDSVFSRVRQDGFALGKTALYENFLLNVRSSFPWMNRTVDAYLLRYYAFRQNGSEMVRYADIMLSRAPDRVEFLQLRARGLMLQDLTDDALETYRHILELEPDNYDTLLTLGNWYADNASHPQAHTLAVDYLSQAYSLRPTPYVARRLKALSPPPQK